MFFKYEDRGTIEAICLRNEGRQDPLVADIYTLMDLFEIPDQLPSTIVYPSVMTFFNQTLKMLTTGTYSVSPMTWLSMVLATRRDEDAEMGMDKGAIAEYKAQYQAIKHNLIEFAGELYPEKNLSKAVITKYLTRGSDKWEYDAPKDLLILAQVSVKMYMG